MTIAAQLKAVFGYDCFLPHQEGIIREVLDGRDVFAVMPTGGGKSLCYQLPARILPGTVVVISPLISLMKDQVDAARANGLQAELLNSTLSASEAAAVYRALHAGRLELLYISPERFAMPHFIEELASVRISLFAIDEAHCISEWGHDFRPDYLELAAIPRLFPDIPIAAFTATATEKVQKDIVARLGLRNPFTLRASFDRQNLFYQVKRKEKADEQILEFIGEHEGESGIVYRTSRDSVMSTSAFLRARGISVLPYHAGLPKDERTRNQESFDNDEVSVIVATIAFGMGIDKSNVRFVIHGDLPRHVESYYQETGRAGRDGAPARCLLLFSPGDIPKLRHFIDRISDDGERAVALEKLRQMAAFASHKACRRRQLLAFFGESYPAQSCGACDVCAGDVEEMDVTTDAQILMSAVMRTSQRFGGGHITDVVMGADTDRIRDLGHNNLKTYGVGKGKDRAHWRFLINELLAQGALVQDGGQYPVLKLTGRGLNILYGRERITALRAPGKKKPAHGATKSTAASEPSRAILAGAPAPPARGLFERLRRLRRSLAEAQGVPPYIIFSDKTLIEMSGRLPVTFPELSTVSGVGEIKLRRYGEAFLREIEAYLAEHPEMRRRVDTTPPGAQGALDERGQSVGVEAAGRAGDATAQEIVSAAVRKELREKPPKEKKKKGESLEETWELLRSGLGIEEIAARRGLVPSTIATHVELLIIMGRPIHLESFVSPEKTEMIEEAFRRLKSRELKAVFEDLGGSAEYWEIRLVRAALRRRKDNLGDSGQSPD